MHNSAELDLMLVQGGQRIGFEFKWSEQPAITRSMRAVKDPLWARYGLDGCAVPVTLPPAVVGLFFDKSSPRTGPCG